MRVVVSGYLLPWTLGRELEVFGFGIPSPMRANPGLHELMERVHGVSGHLFIPLLALHVLGAVKHVAVDRRGLGLRMFRPIPGGGSPTDALPLTRRRADFHPQRIRDGTGSSCWRDLVSGCDADNGRIRDHPPSRSSALLRSAPRPYRYGLCAVGSCFAISSAGLWHRKGRRTRHDHGKQYGYRHAAFPVFSTNS